MGDESYILWRCPRCGLWKCDPDDMPVHRQECGGEFRELEVVPKARLAEVERERDEAIEQLANRDAEVEVLEGLADELAGKALLLAQVVSYPKQHSSADLWTAVSELNAVLGDHRERRERDG